MYETDIDQIETEKINTDPTDLNAEDLALNGRSNDNFDAFTGGAKGFESNFILIRLCRYKLKRFDFLLPIQRASMTLTSINH